MTNPTAPLLSESKPDIKAALRKLQDAAWNCGTDEYRDGVSDAACTRRYDAMIAARAECVSAADALLAENAALREQLAGYKSCVTCACGRPTWHRKEDKPL